MVRVPERTRKLKIQRQYLVFHNHQNTIELPQELKGSLIMVPIVVGLSAFLFGIEASESFSQQLQEKWFTNLIVFQ